MTPDLTIEIYGQPLPARFVTLEDGSPGIEIEGTAFLYVTDEVPHGIKASTNDQNRKLDELRQRLKVTSEAAVLPFEPVEAPQD